MARARSTDALGVVILVVFSAGLISACAGPATAAIAPSASSAPTPKPFDLSQWTVSTVGTGPTATAANGGVDLFIPSDASADPQQHYMAVNLLAKCKLSGDFDLQLDYSLVAWPPRNGVRLGVAAGTYSVERTSNAGYADDRYVTDFGGGPPTSVATTNAAGRLRLTRVGGLMTGYYLHNGGWVTIASTGGSTDAVAYGISAWSEPLDFGKSDVRISVSHFDLAPHGTGCTS